jgi:hypothetical protein
MLFTKERIKDKIINSGKPVAVSWSLCREAFGFKRIDGISFMLTKLFNPSVTEEQMSYISNPEIHDAIQKWSSENGLHSVYDFQKDCYLFSI